ncbi:MAG: homocysteine S-methyltransferase family protein [Eubacteriales bacterium]|nr:homocysteine S-methyltransferase family protein [Eubacteriales bacterium]
MSNAKERFERFLAKKEFIFLDGATGTELQKFGLNLSQPSEYWNLEEPQYIQAIHQGYLAAGSDIIYANTFGSSKAKLAGSPFAQEDLVKAALEIGLKAIRESGKEALLAYDMGPLGKLMYPSGNFTYDKAYEDFAGQVRLAATYGADLILIETMSDLYELKAAILAAKDNSSLPVVCSMTFQTDGRTFNGTDVETYVNFATSLGVEALGINCSNGPQALSRVIEDLLRYSRIPILLKPNAGMPDPATGQYNLTPKSFAKEMGHFAKRGIKLLGGCCGTNTEYIRALSSWLSKMESAKRKPVYQGSASSSVESLNFAEGPFLIGERINPSNKEALQTALQEENYAYVAKMAVEQEACGAQLLDVNVSVPGIDQAKAMEQVVLTLIAVCQIPLVLDSKDPAVLEAGLKAYNAKPIINSLSYRRSELQTILPLAKHYGASLILLPLSDERMPSSAQERIEVLARLKEACLAAGHSEADLIADILALPLEAEPKAARDCLETLRLCQEQLGLRTLVGLSNLSYHLPGRAKINAAFLQVALSAGLDFALADPLQEEIIDSCLTYRILQADWDALDAFSRREADDKRAAVDLKIDRIDADANPETALAFSIRSGLLDEAKKLTKTLLGQGRGLDLIEALLLPLLDDLGRAYQEGEIYLPQLLQAASAAQSALDLIRQKLSLENHTENAEKGQAIVMATVQGDIHDIGKNIAKTILENYGYRVVDLGKDVAPESVRDAVLEHDCRLVGLSALMTATLPAMETTIRITKEAAPDCKFMLGGAVLTENYAYKIGADYFCADANSDVAIAREVFKDRQELGKR